MIDDAKKLEELARQLSAMRRRAHGLGQDREASQERALPLTDEALEALDATVEVLRVAVEELHQKNHEIEASELAIDEERRRYRELFEFAPDGYLVTDLHGVVREANRPASALLNLEHHFLLGKPLAVFIPEEGRAAFRSELARLGQVLEPVDYDLRLVPRHRPPFEAALRVAVARDPGGLPVALRWTIRDVSEQKRAEEQIRALNAELEGRVAERSEQLEAELETNERWLIKAHAASAASEAQGGLFHDLVQESDAIFWKLDAATGRYTFVNRRAEEVLGFSVDRWLEDPEFWSERLHPDDREWAIAHRRGHLSEGRDHEAEYRLMTAAGRAVWFRESVRVVRDERGTPREVCGLIVNISRRKRVERQLYTAKGQLAARLEDMTHLYELGLRLAGGLDLKPMLREVLAAVTSLLGTATGRVLLLDRDRDLLEVVAEAGLPEGFAAAPGGGAPVEALETRGVAIVEDLDVETEADPFTLALAGTARLGGFRAAFSHPLLNQRGEFLGAITTFFADPHRPSDRQVGLVGMYARLAAEFIENARVYGQIEESDRRKAEFLAMMAHELRSPLGAILNASQLLHQGEADDPALVHAREVVERQTKQMARMVDDLLDATRLRNGTLELRKEPIDLAAALARAVETARPALDARRHELALTVPEGAMTLLADPDRLEQVLVNLLTNAAKYTEPGGRIALEAHRRGGQAVVRVRDGGIGIAPELLPKVFDLFMQADRKSDRGQQGLGIGLWIVRRLVERHGGTIEVTSDGPGRGSEFVVRLPLLEPTAHRPPRDLAGPAAKAKAPPALAVPDTKPKRILVVDDDDDSAQVLSRLLRGWGHEAHIAVDGTSAIEAIRRLRPDVVLLDIGLPGMDGYEVARKLKEAGDLVAVQLIALTGYSQEADLRQAFESGFHDVWIKPISPDILRQHLRAPKSHGSPLANPL